MADYSYPTYQELRERQGQGDATADIEQHSAQNMSSAPLRSEFTTLRQTSTSVAVDDPPRLFHSIPKEYFDFFVPGNTESDQYVRYCAASTNAWGSLVVRLVDGTEVHAIRLADAVSQGRLPSREIAQPGQVEWSHIRGSGRPEVLYKIRPDSDWHRIYDSVVSWNRLRLDNRYSRPYKDLVGRVLLNDSWQPIRHIPHFPPTFDRKVDGWYIEALWRIYPCFNMHDILDRIVGEKPTQGTLTSRQTAARKTMRILHWPIDQRLLLDPAPDRACQEVDGYHPLVYELTVAHELAEADHRQNSTFRFRDLNIQPSGVRPYLENLVGRPLRLKGDPPGVQIPPPIGTILGSE